MCTKYFPSRYVAPQTDHPITYVSLRTRPGALYRSNTGKRLCVALPYLRAHLVIRTPLESYRSKSPPDTSIGPYMPDNAYYHSNGYTNIFRP